MKRGKTWLMSIVGASIMMIAGCPFLKPPVEQTEFTEFVSDLILNETDDTTEPADIDELEFVFANDESSFDGVLQQAAVAE